jgi:ribonuclease P protein component
MIAKRLRVSPRDFPKDAPIRFRSPYFLVKTRPNGLDRARFAVIVPAAAVPAAVRRHQLKRWMLGRIPRSGRPGTDILFIITSGARTAPKAKIDAAFDEFARSIQ